MADSETASSNHVAMFPWFAFGHFIPFLHLSNKLAERGCKVSFLLPKGAIPKLIGRNKFPDLIQFLPLTVPHVDGLPPGAETVSDVPEFSLQNHLCTAMDNTKDQVKAIFSHIKPEFVIFDFSFWIPSLGKEMGFKTISFVVQCAALPATGTVPSKRWFNGMTNEEINRPPPGFPSTTVVRRPGPTALTQEFGSGVLFYDRLVTSRIESDAIAIITCYEIEAAFVNYLEQQFQKPVLLTGPLLSERSESPLDEKWDKWLSQFEAGSVVYCAFGSQIQLEKHQFQELVLGFELSELPFLVALPPPKGCSTVAEALPEGFKDRVGERGMVYGGWVPQPQILDHPSVGCFVSHGGSNSMWESLLSDCQIVLIPIHGDHTIITMLMDRELKAAVEVEKEANGWICKEQLSQIIKLMLNTSDEKAMTIKTNHAKWRKLLSEKNLEEKYLNTFLKNLQGML